MFSDLKWDSIQTRREKARLVKFYRVTPVQRLTPHAI